MMILSLVRNYLPSHEWVVKGGWNIADCVARSYDLEGMEVGTVAAGRIGQAVLRRLKPFDVKLHYTDRHRLPQEVEQELGVTYHPDVASMVPRLRRGHHQLPAAPGDGASVQRRADRHDEAGGLPGQHRTGQDLRPRRRGAGPGERSAGRLRRRCLVPAAGAAGPPLADDAPPRHDAAHSGTSLSAQARYAAGTREILECWFEGRPIREEYLIVDGGQLAGTGAHSYSVGGAAGGR